MTTTFDKLGIGAPIIQALKENGFESPFPIQQAAIPFLLKGVDVVGQAHTGTGKTAAFSLPILTKIKNKGPIQALHDVPFFIPGASTRRAARACFLWPG